MYPLIDRSLSALTVTGLVLMTSLMAIKAMAGLPEDPYRSPMWQYNIERYLGDDARVVHSEQVQVKVPGFAEDSAQVPLTLTLDQFDQDIQRIVSWVDLNPVPHLFSYQPHHGAPGTIALNFRVQQATTVRAAVQDMSGIWHIGSARLDAAGGGCTAPSETASNPHWSDQLGNTHGKQFARPDGTRLKLQIMHPMDSGMVSNIPLFHINEIQIHRSGAHADTLIGRMKLSESAAENPQFVFDFSHPDNESYTLSIRDTQANTFRRTLSLNDADQLP